MALFFTARHNAPGGTAHDFSFMGIDEHLLPLSRFAGMVVLVVNTASQCGFTAQYADLQKLYETYRERGLVVLGVPSDDFGGQEPGDDAAIRRFCADQFGVTFPMAGKTSVRGEQAHPFYLWADSQVTALGRPRWNFHKFLIGPDGRLVDWFASMTNPLDPKVIAGIEAILPKVNTPA